MGRPINPNPINPIGDFMAKYPPVFLAGSTPRSARSVPREGNAAPRGVGLDESKILQEFAQESDRNRRALDGIRRGGFSVGTRRARARARWCFLSTPYCEPSGSGL